MIITFGCDLAGGILVGDPAVLRGWDRDVVAHFAVALDPDGQTGLTYDYPQGGWRSIWRAETQGLVERCNRGEMAFLVLHRGLFSIDVDVGGVKEIRNDRGAVEFRSRIFVGSGAVAVAEADKLMERWPRPPKEDYYRVFPLRNGEYLVRFVIVKDPEVIEEETFGTPEKPAIHVQIVPRQGEAPQLHELFRYAF